jgi:hypothetical protein
MSAAPAACIIIIEIGAPAVAVHFIMNNALFIGVRSPALPGTGPVDAGIPLVSRALVTTLAAVTHAVAGNPS